jgi:hypothetical protein
MEYLTQQFLKQNNLTGRNGIDYSLRDDGEGAYIDKWDYEISKPKFTQEQLDKAILAEVKINKLSDLNKFYNSPECWTFKVFTNDANPAVLKGTYASLTRDADFFAKVIPASLGKTMTILDDNNQPVQYFLDAIKGQNLNYKINNENGTKIQYRRLELENQINIAKDINSVNNVDIVNQLVSAVGREINLDNFK